MIGITSDPNKIGERPWTPPKLHQPFLYHHGHQQSVPSSARFHDIEGLAGTSSPLVFHDPIKNRSTLIHCSTTALVRSVWTGTPFETDRSACCENPNSWILEQADSTYCFLAGLGCQKRLRWWEGEGRLLPAFRQRDQWMAWMRWRDRTETWSFEECQ